MARSMAKATTTAAKEDTAVVVNDKTKKVVKEVKEEAKPVKNFAQTDLVQCRNVTAGWLGMTGAKSKQYYVFSGTGDIVDVEYGDLLALKTRHSAYIYDPKIIIEDEELLEDRRWQDVAEFYNDKVYGMDDIDELLNLPVKAFEQTLKIIPKGLMKAAIVEVAKRIEDGSFDSLKKIKIIDEVCGTEFHDILG